MGEFLQVLVRTQDEIEEFHSKLRFHRFRWDHGALARNKILCAEIAGREINARSEDSSHSRLEAIDAARKFTAYREQEDAVAWNWWVNLTSADRNYLPDYDIRECSEEKRALLTYRNYLACLSKPVGSSSKLVAV